MTNLRIADRPFLSRLLMGTGKYGSLDTMAAALKAAEAQLVTVALKRISTDKVLDDSEYKKRSIPSATILDYLKHPQIQLLPNTSGARSAEEAIFAAELAREALGTSWIKLEIHPDPRYLMPDPIETLKATTVLAKAGFIVLPYIHADPVLCKRLEGAGSAAVMPLGSPIGSNQGLKTIDFLRIIIEQSNVPVIIDAGLGAPSDAALAMEIGADAVLVNTAIATAQDPVRMAEAFRNAVQAGRMAYEAGMPTSMPGLLSRSSSSGQDAVIGRATSPRTAFLGND